MAQRTELQQKQTMGGGEDWKPSEADELKKCRSAAHRKAPEQTSRAGRD